MIRLSVFRIAVVAQCVFCCVETHSFNQCFAQPEDEKQNMLPLSPDISPLPGWTVGRTIQRTVQWEQREYLASEGIEVLMRVITGMSTNPDVRGKALERLGALWPWMQNTDHIPELIALYDELREREEKGGVLQCLLNSNDPLGLPLFVRVLNHEKDIVVRLFAANALAIWNVRRGVKELITLLDSHEVDPEGQMFAIKVWSVLYDVNVKKGWGLLGKNVRKRIESRSDLSQDQTFSLVVVEAKKWFTANEHRFPEWKPGDPLPEVEASLPIPPIVPGPESVLLLSAAFMPSPTQWTAGQEKEEVVSWQGKRYPAAKAVEVFMKVAMNGIVNDRFLAIERLERLERLGSQLRNTERIPQLMKLYARLTDRSDKVALLFCLARSKDRRTIPLFSEILDTTHEEYLRLPASFGLAMWNVRRGVYELIELLTAKQTESPIRYPGIMADQAAGLLLQLNYWKSWSAPEAVLQAAVEARTEVHDEMLHSCHLKLKKWFAENAHRFPVWKPGDQLPKIVKDDSVK